MPAASQATPAEDATPAKSSEAGQGADESGGESAKSEESNKEENDSDDEGADDESVDQGSAADDEGSGGNCEAGDQSDGDSSDGDSGGQQTDGDSGGQPDSAKPADDDLGDERDNNEDCNDEGDLGNQADGGSAKGDSDSCSQSDADSGEQGGQDCEEECVASSSQGSSAATTLQLGAGSQKDRVQAIHDQCEGWLLNAIWSSRIANDEDSADASDEEEITPTKFQSPMCGNSGPPVPEVVGMAMQIMNSISEKNADVAECLKEKLVLLSWLKVICVCIKKGDPKIVAFHIPSTTAPK